MSPKCDMKIQQVEMVFCFLFFTITFRKTTHIYTYLKQYELANFGFDDNGYYSFNFSIPEDLTDDLHIVLLNSTTFFQQKRKSFGQFNLCQNETIPKIMVNKSNSFINGTIEDKTILYPYLLRCTPNGDIFIKLTVHEQHQNPSSFLDNRLYNGKSSQIFIVALFLVLAISWGVNWGLHFDVQHPLHYCLSCVIISFLLTHILRTIELNVLHKSDNSHGLTEAHVFFVWLSFTLLCFFLLIASHGYGIVVDSISIRILSLYVIISIWFVSFPIVLIYGDPGQGENFIYLLVLIGILTFGYFLLTNIRREAAQAVGLSISLSNSFNGTKDNSSSSTFLKNQLYKYFTYILLGGAILYVIYLAIDIAVLQMPLWASEMTYGLIEIIFVSSFSLLFIIRRNYQEIGGDEVPLTSFESTERPLLQRI
ncbi:hypothetical protein TRFO_11999 [Tritrichomonas foetus]|uniref:Intimal thickness related receptor IRP domain-containing protein n=1 Tax=Tritrichomonas foetus TaxID=1144522 RepID=A0A1J4J0X2_9EUKA|nr:hypothetical protein TRFO_11999 [Tritrichomonas foetus]|eukprot:OHS93184.1 hypothetical protein TRFO_11999 [Tritrichomonas foetus]